MWSDNYRECQLTHCVFSTLAFGFSLILMSVDTDYDIPPKVPIDNQENNWLMASFWVHFSILDCKPMVFNLSGQGDRGWILSCITLLL